MMTAIRRQTAYVCTTQQLRTGTYVKQEGWNPNYVELEGKAVCRARIAGIIISQTSPFTYIVDDGTGIITAQLFEQRTLRTGVPVMIIGRPRREGEELCLNTEIIRETSKEWVSHYQQEREAYQAHIQLVNSVRGEEDKTQQSEHSEQPKREGQNAGQSNLSAERSSQNTEQKQNAERNSQTTEQGTQTTKPNPVQQLLQLIKTLDPGDGAPTADVLLQATNPNAEQQLNMLISEGEVFELRAGKIKVLE